MRAPLNQLYIAPTLPRIFFSDSHNKAIQSSRHCSCFVSAHTLAEIPTQNHAQKRTDQLL